MMPRALDVSDGWLGAMLTVLSLNIWGGGPLWRLRRKALARRIAQLGPDLIGLQEVHARSTSGEASQAHDLADLLADYRVIFAPARIAASGRCEGVALLSRDPVREHSVKTLSQDPRDALDRFGPRVVLHALVERPEGAVDVFVTHLSISRAARSRTVPELLTFAHSRSPLQRAVLMGDLNAEPSEPSLNALEQAGWLDAWKSAHGPERRGGTWPARAPFRRIDYIFVLPAAARIVRACERAAVRGSDHLGVVARLDWAGVEDGS